MAISVGGMLAAFRVTLLGDPEEMVITLGFANADADGSPQDLVEGLADDWESVWTNQMSTQYSFAGVTGYVGQDGSGSAVFETNRGVAGTKTNAPLPSNCSQLVRKNTAGAGRRNRGRFYPVGMLFEEDVDANGNYGPANVTLYQGLWNQFFGLVAPRGGGPVIFHAVGDQTPTPVTGLSFDAKIATQRQRMRR